MEREFWETRWEEGRIGFHASETDGELTTHWASLGVPADALVLVPLCGKSLDMLWLREQGHRVLGAELSPVAVDAFFAENEIPFERDGTTLRGDGIEIWNGDLFDLGASDMADVRGIYDRAALVAMPPEMRARYAKHLVSIVPAGAPVLLQTIEFDQELMAGPPFSVDAAEVHKLYGGAYHCEELVRRRVVKDRERFRKAGVNELDEIVWRLSAR